MFSKIQALFTDSKNEECASPDESALQLASAVLLIEIVKADFDTDPDEEKVVRESLKSQFSIDDSELDELFSEAKQTGEDAVSLHSFIRTINENCDDEQKFSLMVNMWKVAYADGRLDKYEDYNIRKIADLLYVSHQVFIQSKQKVLANIQ